MITYKMDGFKELSTMLRELPTNISRNLLLGGMSAGAALVKNEAKQIAPVYHGDVSKGHPPPGTLKRAIAMKRSKNCTDQRAIYEVFVRQSKNGRVGQKSVKAYGKFDAYYWRWVEYGTAKMAPEPFMRPAFDAKKMESVEAVKNYIAHRIPDEIAKLK